MRYKITLKSSNHYFSQNFSDYLSIMIYKEFSRISELYFNDFMFYTFSDFVIENYYLYEDESFYSRDGKVTFTVSSPHDYFIRYVLATWMIEGIDYEDYHFDVNDLHLLEYPNFTRENVFTVNSICVNSSNFEEDLAEYLETLLLKNYCKYYHLDSHDSDFKIFIVKISEESVSWNDECIYRAELSLEGDTNMIKFAWDSGLGESTFKGHGLLNLIKS